MDRQTRVPSCGMEGAFTIVTLPDLTHDVRRGARSAAADAAWISGVKNDEFVAPTRDGLAAVAEWKAEHGPFTAVELDETRHRVGRLAQRSSTAPRR